MSKAEKFNLIALFAILAFIVAVVSLWVSVDLNHSVSTELKTEEELAVLTVKQEIYDRFGLIFLTVVSVLAAISGIFGIGAFTLLKGRIENEISTSVDRIVHISQRTTQAWAFAEFGYIWSQNFEKTLLKCRQGKKVTGRELEEASTYVDLALKSASTGIRTIPAETETYSGHDRLRVERYRVHLLNQLIYCETARLIFNTAQRPNSASSNSNKEYFDELLSQADQIYSSAKDLTLVRSGLKWYDVHETIGFFKLYFGRALCDKEIEASASKTLWNLIDRDVPKPGLDVPPEDWAKFIEAEYLADKDPLTRQ